MYRSSRKVPFILVLLYRNFHFFDRFSKNPQISNFTKIGPVEAELFHADGRTHMTKLMVAFRNFANAPKKLRHRTRRRSVIKAKCVRELHAMS